MIYEHGRHRSILFVCTGNIFRSLAAEQAFKVLLGPTPSYLVGSAGIDAKPQAIHDWVKTRLSTHGGDPSSHVQRQLTREMVENADLILAMGRNHQDFIRERFGRNVPLYNQVCCDRDEPILDIHEVMPAWEENPDRARTYVWSVIDQIWERTPLLISRLRLFG